MYKYIKCDKLLGFGNNMFLQNDKKLHLSIFSGDILLLFLFQSLFE